MKDGKFETETFRRRIRAGDGGAWGELFHAYDPLMRAVAGRVLPDRLDPEGAAQETWVRALQKARRFNVGKALYPWLCSICLNHCLTCLRKDKLWRFIRRSDPGGWRKRAVSGGAMAAIAEDRAWIRTYIARLSRQHQEIIYLRFACSLEHRAIAEALDLESPETARRRLSRAKARLKSLIEEDGSIGNGTGEKRPGEGPKG